MIEKIKISYRDFDYSSFDINNRDVEQENEYKALLSQAYKANPQNATEKEVLADYIKTLKEIIAYQAEINEIRSIIQALPSDALQGIEDLKQTAAQKAACIYSREQDLFVIKSLGSNLLGKVLERSQEQRAPKQECLRVRKHSRIGWLLPLIVGGLLLAMTCVGVHILLEENGADLGFIYVILDLFGFVVFPLLTIISIVKLVFTILKDKLWCPQCGTRMPLRSEFCSKCGHKIKLYCSDCKQLLKKDASFCHKCGKNIDKSN